MGRGPHSGLRLDRIRCDRPVCPDERYVRVAVGFDGQDGAMIRSAHSGGEEKIETAIRVEQAGAQSQA